MVYVPGSTDGKLYSPFASDSVWRDAGPFRITDAPGRYELPLESTTSTCPLILPGLVPGCAITPPECRSHNALNRIARRVPRRLCGPGRLPFTCLRFVMFFSLGRLCRGTFFPPLTSCCSLLAFDTQASICLQLGMSRYVFV